MASDMFHQWACTLSRVSRNEPSLTWIDAMCFLMGDDGARRLADAMETNSNVTKLNLRLNHIGSQGIAVIVDALERNSSVIELNLGANELGDEGAIHVARLLARTRSLEKLSLIRCNITAAGTSAIARSLRSNTSLTWLNIAENNQGANHEGVDQMIEALQKNKNIRHLNIDTRDATQAQQVSELCGLNARISILDKNFRNTLLRADGNNSDDVSLMLYPDAWSKFTDIPGAIGVLFVLIKESQSVFSHASHENRRRCLKT